MTEQTRRRTATVNMAGRDYEITALPMGPAREWRKQFGQPIQAILTMAEQAVNVELNSVADISRIIQPLLEYLLPSMDLLADALFDYSPALREDRDWIEANATDEEALAALWEVLKLAYPFGNLVNFVNGRGTIGTRKKSPSHNGA